ncbi:hypothetical protein ABK040_002136 [Willaertia magna]
MKQKCNLLMKQISSSQLNLTLKPVKYWTKFVEPIEQEAKIQIENIRKLPIVHKHIAVMPDVHLGKGATVGTVIPTKSAIIPAAVGVDIGCGMCAVKTNLNANQLKSLSSIRKIIEDTVPHGRSNNGKKDVDEGAFRTNDLPDENIYIWNSELKSGFNKIISSGIGKKYINDIESANHINHLGTLGTGNHFIEICIDQYNDVWIMLHSGSRGIGNTIGRIFIELAKEDMLKNVGNLPDDKDLAYLREGTKLFDAYWHAVKWAQEYASKNREIMMKRIINNLRNSNEISDKNFKTDLMVVNCHHNYVEREVHFDEEMFITRKGAVSAKRGEYGIIPGSMGARSYIVKGKGNPESFCSCSHGAGRKMSRNEAKKQFSKKDVMEQTKDVECRKDEGIIDEIPSAYKSIDDVMNSQEDLVEIVYTLKQIICVKG